MIQTGSYSWLCRKGACDQSFGRAFEPASAALLSAALVGAVDACLAPVHAAPGIFLPVQIQTPVQMQQMRSFSVSFMCLFSAGFFHFLAITDRFSGPCPDD